MQRRETPFAAETSRVWAQIPENPRRYTEEGQMSVTFSRDDYDIFKSHISPRFSYVEAEEADNAKVFF
jgi:hypothetical protein